jgi:hypothetical protein
MSGHLAELAAWSSFYVIVGSAAGALIGLQFVVMTLLAERPPVDAAAAGAAFASPTIVHFGVVLLLAVLLNVPWSSIAPAAALAGILGLTGLAYVLVVARRMRRQRAYTPGPEDWLFHAALPAAAYAALALSSFAPGLPLRSRLFGVGAVAVVLLFVSIHNAWDNVAYHVLVSRRENDAGRHAR